MAGTGDARAVSRLVVSGAIVLVVIRPKDDAESLVRERFPAALIAIVGEAVLGSQRTAPSDLDLVVVADGVDARWEGFRTHDLPAEIFVADLDGWNRYIQQEIRDRHPVVLRITAVGVPLTQNEATAALQRQAGELLSAGPTPASQAELGLARRLVADLIDDLRGGVHHLEEVLVVEAVTRQVAELVLLAQRRWLGVGKWLARLLDDADSRLARELDAAARASHTGEVEPLIAAATRALDMTGGPVPDEWSELVTKPPTSPK